MGMCNNTNYDVALQTMKWHNICVFIQYRTNKCTNIKIIFFYTQFAITPCFDLSWASSGSYWTSIKHIYRHGWYNVYSPQFVKPSGCVCSIRLFVDVFIMVCIICLLGTSVIPVSALIKNSYNKTNKCTYVEIIFLHKICYIFSMFSSWSCSGRWWTSV
jgi:hypothetical protein